MAIYVRENDRFLTITTKQFEPPSSELTKRCEFKNSFQSEIYVNASGQSTKSAVTVWVFEKKQPKFNIKLLLERLDKNLKQQDSFKGELDSLSLEFEAEVIKALEE